MKGCVQGPNLGKKSNAAQRATVVKSNGGRSRKKVSKKRCTSTCQMRKKSDNEAVVSWLAGEDAVSCVRSWEAEPEWP